MASNLTFVRQLYQTVLARDPDDAGAKFWADQLDSGFSTRAQVAYGFMSGSEFLDGTETLARLYNAAFARSPDVPGLQFWMKTWKTGASLEQIATQFMQSQEFKTLYGSASNNGQLVDILYQNVLDRKADSGGKAYWTELLNNGMSSGALLNGFAHSKEFKDKANPQIDNALAYYAIVGRAPTDSELAATPSDLRTIVLDAVGKSATTGSTGSYSLNFDTNTLYESTLNDGSLGNALTISLTGDTFKGDIGASLGKVTNVPSGLKASLTKTTDTTATLMFTGNAKSHTSANSISNLSIGFTGTDFTTGATTGKTGLTQSAKVVFIDVQAEESGGILTLAGTITSSLKIDLSADKLYSGSNASTLLSGSMDNVLDVDATGVTGSKLTVTFTGDSNNNGYKASDLGGTINGAKGADTLTGGGGTDRFVFATTAADNGVDVIRNFKIGTGGDILDFSAFLNKTGTSHIAPVTSDSSAGAAWANGDVLVIIGNGLETEDDIAAVFAGGAYAAATAAGKAVVISADIVGDASIWYVVNQTTPGTVAASEITLVGTLEGINNLGLSGYGFAAANFG